MRDQRKSQKPIRQKTRTGDLSARRTPLSPFNRDIKTILRMAINKPTGRTEIIQTKDLLEDETDDSNPDGTSGRPHLTFHIENEDVAEVLIDTGAEITVLSQSFAEKLFESNPRLPTLPVSQITVSGVISKQNIKIRIQIMAKIKLRNLEENVTFLIFEGLTKNGIVGSDFLEKQKSVLKLKRSG